MSLTYIIITMAAFIVPIPSSSSASALSSFVFEGDSDCETLQDPSDINDALLHTRLKQTAVTQHLAVVSNKLIGLRLGERRINMSMANHNGCGAAFACAKLQRIQNKRKKALKWQRRAQSEQQALTQRVRHLEAKLAPFLQACPRSEQDSVVQTWCPNMGMAVLTLQGSVTDTD